MGRSQYPINLTDVQWRRFEPHIPGAKPGVRLGSADVREVVNAIPDVGRNGVTWWALPHDLLA